MVTCTITGYSSPREVLNLTAVNSFNSQLRHRSLEVIISNKSIISYGSVFMHTLMFAQIRSDGHMSRQKDI